MDYLININRNKIINYLTIKTEKGIYQRTCNMLLISVVYSLIIIEFIDFIDRIYIEPFSGYTQILSGTSICILSIPLVYFIIHHFLRNLPLTLIKIKIDYQVNRDFKNNPQQFKSENILTYLMENEN